MGNEHRGSTQSVLRACEILKCFRDERETLLLSDVVARTALRRTTTFRLLQTLVQSGLVERVGRGLYRCRMKTLPYRPIRMGFAYQTDSQFCREVIQSLERAAARYGVHLVTVNNRYSSREALHNADLLIREAVDLVFEFQPYEQIAPMISSKFSAAGIPVIAVELPHPGAMFYGANNYQAGIIGGRALGKWTRTHWHGSAEELVLLELPIAGKLPSVRMKGMADGLRTELPDFDSLPVMHLDGKGDFQRVFTVMKRFFNQRRPKKTLVCAVNDICALAAIRAVEEIGGDDLCAVVGQNAIPEARQELRRPGTRLIGSVAFFPERYGDELIPLALAVLQNRPVPAASFVKHQLITSKNVDLAYPLDTQTCQEHVCGAKS